MMWVERHSGGLDSGVLRTIVIKSRSKHWLPFKLTNMTVAPEIVVIVQMLPDTAVHWLCMGMVHPLHAGKQRANQLPLLVWEKLTAIRLNNSAWLKATYYMLTNYHRPTGPHPTPTSFLEGHVLTRDMDSISPPIQFIDAIISGEQWGRDCMTGCSVLLLVGG